jgi:hypothetical protein
VGKELPLEGEQSGQANLRTDGEVTAENMQQLKPSEEKAQTVERTLQIDNDLAFDSALAVVSTELSQRIHRLNNRLYKKE